jgi:uncharacterized protein (DUF2235 family)
VTDDLPLPASPRPLWLVTLADLALLLLGFVVLVHAIDRRGRASLSAGLRARFAASAAAVQAPLPAIPVAATGAADFAPGSARLAGSPDELADWARDAVRDPRVTLTITGWTDGSAADRDPASGSAALLAADRARAVATVLAPVVPARRLVVTTSPHAGRRAAIVTLAFTGDAR